MIYLTLQNFVNDQQKLCSCAYCMIYSISKGDTEDFGIMDIPNVNLDIKYFQVLRCKSTNIVNHVNTDGILIIENDNGKATIKIKNCLQVDNV